MNKNVVVIPAYKQEMSTNEQASFVQCLKILKLYDIMLVVPESLNVENYLRIAQENNKNISFVKFVDKHFSSLESYSKLMLMSSFYKAFEHYEYMLIYQLDAWVFRDELDYWCKEGYDYIGAPWFEGLEPSCDDAKMLDIAGNGGFSLRKISSFISLLQTKWPSQYKIRKLKLKQKNIANYILSSFKNENTVEDVFLQTTYYEDLLFANLGHELCKEFKTALPQVALPFSFEVNPRKLYEMNGNKLPFGCHAFEKYDWEFFKEYIEIV